MNLGARAFNNCSSLTGIVIPGGLKTIKEKTFADCKKLADVALGSVNTIEANAFNGCSSLRSVTIPGSSVGEYAFANCESLQWAKLASTITSISEGMFCNCKNLRLIHLSNTLTSIGTKAFADCANLTTLYGNYYENLETIGDMAFSGCKKLESFAFYKNLQTIGESAFYECVSLESVSIPGNEDLYIKASAFEKCTGLKSVDLGEGLTLISAKTFAGCSKIKSIIVPYSVDTIAASAFEDCTVLEYVVMNRNAFDSEEFADTPYKIYYFYSVDYAQVGEGEVLGHGLSHDAGNYLSYYNDEFIVNVSPWGSYRIEKVTLSIGEDTVELKAGTDGKYRYTMPDKTSEDDEVIIKAFFKDTPTLASGTCGSNGFNLNWTIRYNGELIISGYGDMADWQSAEEVPWNEYRNAIRFVTLSEDVTSIGGYAFTGCKDMETIKIPYGVTTIGKDAFAGCEELGYVLLNKTAYSQEAFPEIPVKAIHYYSVVNYTNDGHGIVLGKRYTSGNEVLEFEVTPFSSYLIDKVTVEMNGKTETVFADASGKYCYTVPEENSDITVKATFTEKIHTIMSGTCGQNLTWALDEYGTLTISGSGAMDSFTESVYAPWYSYRQQIKKLVIENGATSIGSRSFTGLVNLASITIPSSVTTIENYAFYGCKGITGLKIPDTVTNLGDGAFSHCESLASVTLPKNMKSIPRELFDSCSALKSITIPEGVVTIYNNAFNRCVSLSDISIPSSVKTIGENAFASCISFKKLIIPRTVTGLDKRAFAECLGLDYVALDKNLYNEAAFSGNTCNIYFYYEVEYTDDGKGTVSGKSYSYCNDEMEFTIKPNSTDKVFDKITLTYSGGTVEIHADENGKCVYTMPDSASSVTVKAYFVQAYDRGKCGDNLTWSLGEDGTMTISGDGKMYDWKSPNEVPWQQSSSKITSVVFTGKITHIGKNAFADCKISDLTLPESLTSIGDHAFTGLKGLESVLIPYGVTTVSGGAFTNCSKLSSVVIRKTAYSAASFVNTNNCSFHFYYDVNYQNDGNGTVSGKTVTYGTDVVEFTLTPKRDFAVDKVILTVGTEDFEVTPDKNGNFRYTMPDSENAVTVTATFKQFSNTVAHGTCGEGMVWTLDSNGILYVSGAGEVTAWKGDDFEDYRDNIKKVVFSGNITSIGSGAFDGCTALTEVTLPDTLTNIGKNAFSNCTGLTGIEIPDSVKSIGESAFAGCSNIASVKMPASLETIGNSAFAGCKVSDIALPDTVKAVGSNAFSDCRHLKSITIPEGVKAIGDGAFNGCVNLTELTIPKSVTTLGKNVWSGATSIKKISILCNITEIGSYSFYNLVSLTEVNIPSTVKTIGNHAFDGCRSLKKVVIPDAVTSIGDYAFYGCSGMTSLTIGNGITSIPKYAFAGCSSLESLTIPDSVTSIGDYAFSDCSKIVSVKLPEGLKDIGNRAFSHCTKLEDCMLPDGLETVGNYAFQYCGFTYEPLIPSTVTSRGDWIFYGCNRLTSFTIPDGVTTIPDYCFYGFYNLKKIRIPSSVYTIGKWAFAYCTSLTKVNVPDNVNYIGDYAFIYCDKLASVKLSDSIRTIGASTFEECYSLTTVTMSDNVFSIGNKAFYGCSKLKDFNLPSRTSELGDEAFYGCSSLTEITIPNYVFALGDKTFYGCKGLTKVTLPNSLGSIGKQAFYHCESLTGVTIPNSVASIGNEAFCGCKNLKSVKLPDKNVSLGTDAFIGSLKLASVVINKDCYSEDAFGSGYQSKIFHFYYDVAYKADGNGNILGNNRSYGTGVIELDVRPYDGYAINKITLTVGSKTVEIPSSASNITYTMPDSNEKVLISVSFVAKKQYNVIVNSNLGGVAYANVHSAAKGDTVTVTTVPYDGYKVGSMTVNGKPLAKNTFVMGAFDATVEVTFVKIEYTVTVSAGTGGKASVDKPKAVLDDIVTITATPNEGYGVDTIKVNGVVIEGNTFQLGTADAKVAVTFKKLDYNITVDYDDENGEATVGREMANMDDEIEVTVTPKDGYMLDTITVNGQAISGTKFKMPAEDVVVEVTFKKMEYPVTVECGEGGSATVTKTIANAEDEITVTVKPDACFELESITVNGVTLTGNTFTMPAHKVLVKVTFKAKPHMILPVKYKAPTCEEDGHEAYFKCCICGKCYNDEDGHDEIAGPVILKKLGHDLEKVEAKDPTKNDPGNIEYYRCKRDGCGKLFRDAKGTEPITLADTVIPVIGHELVPVPEVPATCTEAGHIAYYKCVDDGCDKIFRDKFGQEELTPDQIIIPATGHHVVEVPAKEPTCEEDGYEAHYKCENCGELYSDADGKNKISAPVKIPKLGHDLHKVDAVPETYIKDGTIEYYECSRCHKKFSDKDGKHELTDEEIIIPKKGAAVLGEEAKVGNLMYRITNPATDGTGTVSLFGVSVKTATVTIPATIEFKDVTYKVVSVSSKAFYGNKVMTSVSIGGNVTVIGGYAFYGCSKLTKVSGGGAVKTIGSYAFAYCSKLKSFTITSPSLATIGSYAFKKDSKLKTVYIRNTTSLTKSGVKKSLKSSSVKTVKVKSNKVKAYKKIFMKSNSGRSVTVKK